MSYIIRTGNLAETPELKEGPQRKYTRAAVVVNDAERDDSGAWETTGSTLYNVTAFGSEAENLVAAAEASGNIRVIFGGRYRVKEYVNKDGEPRVGHDVTADFIGVSLSGQRVTVERSAAAGE
ncbi:single-stranded DNA-binding protein [Nesterenkonia sp.]|uniref:single-stranded DNA-binding protein n=1 Tax=Nesterenkonia sp. TaxID=704201 RepID=UPI002603E4F1|nr:single-stranded DNA-binding protein [Nesterenkonia sp.]